MSRKTRRIALMLDLQWPFRRHTDKFIGAQSYVEAQGWHSIIDEFADVTLANWRHPKPPYDGIIALATKPLWKQACGWGIPLVNVWFNSPVSQKLPSVLLNVAVAGQQCAEHLISRGILQFALFIAPKNDAEVRLAKEFTRVVLVAGGRCTTEFLPADPWLDNVTWGRTGDLLERTLTRCQPPLGIYVCDEGIGRLAVQICQRHRLRVPEDVAVIIGENDGQLGLRPRPSLTSLECGHEKIGYEAARLLHQLMDGKSQPSKTIFVTPPGLIVRESTDFFAVQDTLVAAALQFIAKHCHRPIGQKDVALAVQAEPRTLQNRFRKYLGRPIVTEIRRVRLERAKRELTQTDKRQSAIARDVGFGDQMRMYKVFCRELGLTPGEFRRQFQTKPRS